MLSGQISVRNRKYPIAWTGQFAEHVAVNYIENNTTHPWLHIKIQQLAAKGKLYKDGSRVLSVYGLTNEMLSVVVISLQSKSAVIHTAYITNTTNFSNKTRKSVSGTGKKKKKYLPSDLEISPESIAVSESHGVSEASLRRVLAKFFNGEKPLNKKR